MNEDQLLGNITREIFSPLYQLAVAVAFIYFLYGVVKFINAMRNPEEKNTGKAHLLWGMVGLFIILSVGPILKLFASFFDNTFIY